MAAPGGIQPPYVGFKVRCLSTWLQGNMMKCRQHSIEAFTPFTVFIANLGLGNCRIGSTFPGVTSSRDPGPVGLLGVT